MESQAACIHCSILRLAHLLELFPAADAPPNQLEVEVRSPKVGLMADDVSDLRGIAKVGAHTKAVQAGKPAMQQARSQAKDTGWVACDRRTARTREGLQKLSPGCMATYSRRVESD